MTVAYATPRPFAQAPDRPARGPVQLRTRSIAEGDRGARQTLQLMAGLVKAALRDPVVLERAAAVVQGVPGRSAELQYRAIRDFLAYHLVYLYDPETMELLREPRYLLDRMSLTGRAEGDCDDVAMLGATLGLAVGRPARLVAVGFQGPQGPYSHVYAELFIDGQWREVDTTRPIGQPLVPPSRGMTLEVRP